MYIIIYILYYHSFIFTFDMYDNSKIIIILSELFLNITIIITEYKEKFLF